MKKICLIVLILLLPAYSYAAYKIYLKNGSALSGVISYREGGGEVYLYFSSGSMTIRKNDILKIEEKEYTETEAPVTAPDTVEKKESPDARQAPSQVPQRGDERTAKVSALEAEMDSVSNGLRETEEQEAGLVAAINEKTGRRSSYNLIQMRQLEKELEPLRNDLSAVQQKKAALMQRKAALEDEIRSTR
jgi:hypothetical protein